MAVLNFNILRANVFSVARRHYDGTVSWGIAPLAHWGPHGIGKTWLSETLGRLLGFGGPDAFMWSMNPSNTDPGDWGGIPFPSPCGQYFTRLPAKWAFDAHKAKRALIIVDEAGDAPPAVQAPMQAFLNEDKVGDLRLGGHVRTLLFGNPVEISTNGYDWSMPMANRTGHKDITFGDEQFDAWMRWYISDGGLAPEEAPMDADAEEARVLDCWDDHDADSRAQWGAFLGMKRMLLSIPERGSPEASRAHLTPRTAHKAGQALTASKVHGLSDSDTDEFMTMLVGKTLITEFAKWRRTTELPDYRSILAGTTTWTHNNQRPDLTRMVLNGCVSLAKSHEEAARVWDIMGPLSETEPGLIYTTAEILATKRVENDDGTVLRRLGKGTESRATVLEKTEGARRLLRRVLEEEAA